MIQKLAQCDRYLKSKSHDPLFVEFIRTELETKARAENKNLLVVKMPDDEYLVTLRQHALPDEQRRPVTKNARRLHVLHDWLTGSCSQSLARLGLWGRPARAPWLLAGLLVGPTFKCS